MDINDMERIAGQHSDKVTFLPAGDVQATNQAILNHVEAKGGSEEDLAQVAALLPTKESYTFTELGWETNPDADQKAQRDEWRAKYARFLD